VAGLFREQMIKESTCALELPLITEGLD